MNEIELRKARQQLARTEAALQQSQRLESVGMVASGVAHDFNNLLVGILGNADLLNRRLESHPDAQELLTEIKAAGRRAADLVGQVLAYAGREDHAPRVPVDLNTLVCETHQMIRASLASGVTIHRQLEPDLPAVRGQATGLRQVVMNLLTNASEVSRGESGCVVTLATHSNPDSGTVTLTVTDCGQGMSEETRARIFEPFFTSKPGGRGLGLSICRRIVEQHHGSIEVDSSVDQGTTFRVHLPISGERASQELPEDHQPPRRSAEGLVLVVDDEPSVRELSSRALEGEGYQVLVASGGIEGLDILEAHSSAVNVVVLDWRMIDMDGEEVLVEMARRHLDVPVVLASGHPEELARASVAPNSISSFLKKPFALEDLLLAVERANESSGKSPQQTGPTR